MSNCLFCKIIQGDIPSKKVYEDQDVYVFHDIRPLSDVHFLIIPKAHIRALDEAKPEHQALLGKMLLLAPQLAKQEGLALGPDGGFKTAINTGKMGGQEVAHLHIHVYGKKPA